MIIFCDGNDPEIPRPRPLLFPHHDPGGDERTAETPPLTSTKTESVVCCRPSCYGQTLGREPPLPPALLLILQHLKKTTDKGKIELKKKQTFHDVMSYTVQRTFLLFLFLSNSQDFSKVSGPVNTITFCVYTSSVTA